MWPNSPAIAFAPRTSCPFSSTPTPMPSDTVTATRCRTCSSCRPNQSSPSAHAFAAFSTLTGRPVAASSIRRRSTSRQPRFGANTSRPASSTRPGRLTPTPSQTMRGCAVRRLAIVRATVRTNPGGSLGVGNERCASNRASTLARPTVVVSGRRFTPTMPVRSTLRWRNLGRRPRGSRPMAPSVTHPSEISWSTMAETVLRWRPDRRERSARDIGWLCRRKFSVILPVDLPRGLARGDLEVRQIDLAHEVVRNCIRVASRQSSVVSHSRQSQSGQSGVRVASPSQAFQSLVWLDVCNSPCTAPRV